VVDLPRFSLEDEADVFASCLLAPDAWLLSLVAAHQDDMTSLLREMNTPEVTTAAALHALRRCLLAGWAFVAYGGTMVITTRGTNLPATIPKARLVEALDGLSHGSGEAQLNGYPVMWFRLAAQSELPERDALDTRTDHQILMDAIALIEPDESLRARIAASANGKVGGGLRDAAGRLAAETYQAMRHRFEGWEHDELLEQPDFLLWLAQRSRAIEAGTTKRGRGRS
jgi:hypothetical protein